MYWYVPKQDFRHLAADKRQFKWCSHFNVTLAFISNKGDWPDSRRLIFGTAGGIMPPIGFLWDKMRGLGTYDRGKGISIYK
jgi:hypothetical protein